MLWGVFGIFVLAALAPFVHRLFARTAAFFFAACLLAVPAFAWPNVSSILETGQARRSFLAWIPALGIEISVKLDALSFLFLALICGIGALIFIYARFYLQTDPHLGRFYAYLLLFTGVMLGLVLADDVFFLFVSWELTSVSSFLLIGWNHERPETRKAALTALLVTSGGGLVMLAGFVLLVSITGETQISRFSGDIVRQSPWYVPALLCILTGAFTKSAQFPFSFWLPRAMEAPTPVSAYLHSATMVQGGVYLLARMFSTLGNTREWYLVVTSFGAITMFLGGLIAITQKDAKRILAYSTISVLGLLTMLLGVGTPAAVSAAIAYFFAHSLYKGALFMIAGILDHESGTRDVTQIRGLAGKMPKTTLAAVLAGLSGASVFPFLGFSAKELVVAAIWTSPWLLTLTALTSILLVIVSLSVAYRPFFGGAPVAPKIPHEAPAGMWLGPLLLASLGLFLGLAPHTLEKPFQAAVAAVLGREAPLVLHSWPEFTPLFGSTFATWVVGSGLYSVLLRQEERLERVRSLVDRWGLARMYDASLAGLLRFASWQTRHLQTGHLRHYLLITVVTTIVFVGWPLAHSGPFPTVVTDIELPEFVLVCVTFAAVFLILFTLSRLVVVAALGAIGISVLLIYVIFSAVDLALTQVLVEALTVVIFVLVLHHLPRFVHPSPARIWVPDAIVSILFGATVTLLILMSSTLFPEPILSRYFVTHGLPEAHGRNIVNVILVDFRAMDTLGETTVLCIAGIGVHALLQTKMRNGA